MDLVRVGPEQLELLVDLRAEVLIAANGLPQDADMSEIKRHARRYYEAAFSEGSHIEYLAYTGGRLAGCGALCLYTVLPTCSNPSGHKGYIMNMYTRPAFRRRGIANAVLGRLLQDAAALGIPDVQLEATAAGRPLYERAGFSPLAAEMGISL